MAESPLPTPEELRQLLEYNSDTGALRWRKRGSELFRGISAERVARLWNGRYAGQAAFTAKDGKGYFHGSVFSRNFRAHRIAWAIYHGEWPEGPIDHIDHDRTNNRIANLRSVSASGNCRNMSMDRRNSSGAVGVVWHRGKWQAQIRILYRTLYLGRFDSFDDAVAARKAAEVKHNFHPNHGQHKHVERR